MQLGYFKSFHVLFAIGSGVLYGVAAQLVARLRAFDDAFVVMSVGYVFVLPFVIGALASLSIPAARGFWPALGSAAAASTLCLVVAYAVGWEGSICLIMAAPVYLTVAVLGAVAGHLWMRFYKPGARATRMMLGPLLALPLLSSAFEHGARVDNRQVRVVQNSIDIAATPATVWPEIARVRRIVEPQESLFFTMGFPRPVEATLSHEGVGGVRHASFERGLLFIETVTEWQPERSIRFDIRVDPKHTPLTTLDAHVTVGGNYFDVLEGGYRIEPLGPGRVRLHLDSHHRISTGFNFYTALWSDYLMSEIQANILRVIRARCERAQAVARG